MTYDDVISDIVRGVEAVGTTIMVVGAVIALGEFILRVPNRARSADSYLRLRRALGHTILLGLEVLIIGDIVRTIIVDQTIESVALLGAIVIIRIVLSFSLEIEIDGELPWRHNRGT